MTTSFNKNRFATTFILLIAVFALCLTTGCKKSSSDSDGDTTSGDTTTSETTGSATSTCGIIENQTLAGFNSSSAIEVRIDDILKPDLFIIQRVGTDTTSGLELIQLLGVTSDGVSSATVARGLRNLSGELGTRAFMVPAGSCPITVAGGGLARLAQLFFFSGQSVAEHLIANGSVVPQDNGCGAGNITGCYSSIEVEEVISPTTISSFLWKPSSERDGNLVILVNPVNISVRVNGSSLTNFGPSNGRGTTARAGRSGCSYGANVRVEFFDSADRRVLLANGNSGVTIPNGCNRVDTRF